MPAVTPSKSAAVELRFRMKRPQRHRLLHGYPLAAAMPTADHVGPAADLAFNPHRPHIVGILPHPFCNPAVAGCGYCTFPHEPGNSAKASGVVKSVVDELFNAAWGGKIPTLSSKPPTIAALYFGGGTANMVEPVPFRDLCDAVATAFDCTQAEVTLEGVPAYFHRGTPRLIDVMRDVIPARQHRLSMGIQTFDPVRLKQMGRTAFGDAATFAEVVKYAHGIGFTASADLLFNLPGQSLEEMKSDVQRAIDLGLNHLGLYHLVLFRGLDAAWAEDDGLLAELPDNEHAAANSIELREFLLSRGFVQTSLTNFERREDHDSPRRYVYEQHSFEPDRFQALGFGPSAASYSATADFGHAVKTMNPTSSESYVRAVEKGRRVWSQCFAYGTRDQKVFWLIRRLAALEIDRTRYRELFGSDPLGDFPEVFEAAADANLIEIVADVIRPTPRGMFFSDSIASLIASERMREVRAMQLAGKGTRIHPELLQVVVENSNARGHM